MQIPIYQVDAFSSRLFGGNPAAVCPLEEWLPDRLLQSIAAENNLSETAFYVRDGDLYELRWFTPTVEVDLCGHATLASACVILDLRRELDASGVTFQSPRSGTLRVDRVGDRYVLDFPARPPAACEHDPAIVAAIGAEPRECLSADDELLVFATQADVAALRPDMTALGKLDLFAVIATAPGEDCDFVSRFFAPSKGVPEDPVTGRAHTTLIPYWSSRLGKTKLFARQISARGGELWCEAAGNRVRIGGQAARYLEGVISVER